MERRYLHIHSFIILLTAVLLAEATLRSPASAAAQDQILPLKIKVGDKAPDFVLPSETARACACRAMLATTSSLISTVATGDLTAWASSVSS